MPIYEILLKSFTTRKILYLYIIRKLVHDTKTPIPSLNNKNYKINGDSYRKYLEQLTSLKGPSLQSSYIRQLESLEKDGIILKYKNSSLRFTELGIKVVNFFYQLIFFFGKDNFFNFLEETKDHFKKSKTKLIFLYTLSEISRIALKLEKNREKTNNFKKKRKNSLFKELGEILLPNISIIESLEIYDFKSFIENVAISLKQFPAYRERRNRLIDTIDKSFQILLGKNYDKKKITDFIILHGIFEEWGFLPLRLRSNIQPPLGFNEKILHILKEENQPLYAFIMERSSKASKSSKGVFKFCSKKLQKNQFIRGVISNEVIEILFYLKYISKILNFSVAKLRLIEISIPIPYIEQESMPNICLIPFNEGVFLLTAYTPLYWYISPPIRKISISFPKKFTKTDHVYYTFKDDSLIDMKQFDVSIIYYLLRTLELIVDRIFFRKFKSGRITEDLRKEWEFESEFLDTLKVNSDILRKDTKPTFERISTKQDPLYDSEYLCYYAIPRIKIYYDDYFILTSITLKKEKYVYFQLFKSNNLPNPMYSKIVKLVKKTLK